jgi:hypothetical protein
MTFFKKSSAPIVGSVQRKTKHYTRFKPADEYVGAAFDAQGSRYLTAKDIAEAVSLSLHIFHDRAERERKQIPHLMLGGNLRFSLQAILEWEIANSVPGNVVSAVVEEAEATAEPPAPAKRWYELVRVNGRRP